MKENLKKESNKKTRGASKSNEKMSVPPSHLFHLFVKPEFHGRGIGRQLFETGLDWINSHTSSEEPLPDTTVNASLNSITVYEQFGFKKQGEVQTINDVTFQPMLLVQHRSKPEAT